MKKIILFILVLNSIYAKDNIYLEFGIGQFSYKDYNNELEIKHNKINFELSAAYQVSKNFKVGPFVYKTFGERVELETEELSTINKEAKKSISYSAPTSYGILIKYKVNNEFQTVFEIGASNTEDQLSGNMLGIGLEYKYSPKINLALKSKVHILSYEDEVAIYKKNILDYNINIIYKLL
jgi:hypothetical protein